MHDARTLSTNVEDRRRDDQLSQEFSASLNLDLDVFNKVMRRVNRLESGRISSQLSRIDKAATWKEAEQKTGKAEECFFKAAQLPPGFPAYSSSQITGRKNKAHLLMEKGFALLFTSARLIYSSGQDGPRLINLLGAILAEEDEVNRTQRHLDTLSELEQLKMRYANSIVSAAQAGGSQFQILREGIEQAFQNRLIKRFSDGTCWLISDGEYGRTRYGHDELESSITERRSQSKTRMRNKLIIAEEQLHQAIANDMDPDIVEKVKEYFVDAALDANENMVSNPAFLRKFGKTLLNRKMNEKSQQEKLDNIWNGFVGRVQQGERPHLEV